MRAGATKTQSQEEYAGADEREWVNRMHGGTYPVMRKGVRDVNGLSEAQYISLLFLKCNFENGLYNLNPRR